MDCEKLVSEYGNLQVAYQLLSDGSANGGESLLYSALSFSEAVVNFARCGKRSLYSTKKVQVLYEDAKQQEIPSYFATQVRGAGGDHPLFQELKNAGFFHKSPAYIESGMHHPLGGELILHLLTETGILAPPSFLSLEDVLDNEAFLYIGEKYSGSYVHQHGSACCHSTGRRLWILFDTSTICRLDGSHPSLPISRQNISTMHPLDIIQHYPHMRELQVAPTLHIQEKDEWFCFPERMFHGTINLEPVVAPSFVFLRSVDNWDEGRCCASDGSGDTCLSEFTLKDLPNDREN